MGKGQANKQCSQEWENVLLSFASMRVSLFSFVLSCYLLTLLKCLSCYINWSVYLNFLQTQMELGDKLIWLYFRIYVCNHLLILVVILYIQSIGHKLQRFGVTWFTLSCVHKVQMSFVEFFTQVDIRKVESAVCGHFGSETHRQRVQQSRDQKLQTTNIKQCQKLFCTNHAVWLNFCLLKPPLRF